MGCSSRSVTERVDTDDVAGAVVFPADLLPAQRDLGRVGDVPGNDPPVAPGGVRVGVNLGVAGGAKQDAVARTVGVLVADRATAPVVDVADGDRGLAPGAAVVLALADDQPDLLGDGGDDSSRSVTE
jgi:hypothetical protein